MPVCKRCEQSVRIWEMEAGVCATCRHQAQMDARKAKEAKTTDVHPDILLSTETWLGREPEKRLGIVTAECVLGMSVFKDLAALGRDFFGGRSEAFQKQLREAKDFVFAELRREAHDVGANAVIAVDLDYSEISGGGKSMLFVVASGTAVVLSSGAPNQ